MSDRILVMLGDAELNYAVCKRVAFPDHPQRTLHWQEIGRFRDRNDAMEFAELPDVQQALTQLSAAVEGMGSDMPREVRLANAEARTLTDGGGDE